MTTNRSSEELEMRALIVPQLRERYPTARIIHELPLRYSTNRIDLAAVTETDIVSVEIKSSKDVMTRLEGQLRAFAPISARVIVALAPKWNEKLPVEVIERKNYTSYVPRFTETQTLIRSVGCSWIDIWTVDAAQGLVEVTQDSTYREHVPWVARMLHMLHVTELADIAERHRITIGKRPTHLSIYRECCDLMTGREIIRAVCRALRERDAFCDGTDPPILEAAP